MRGKTKASPRTPFFKERCSFAKGSLRAVRSARLAVIDAAAA
jgi:hypothetical protein